MKKLLSILSLLIFVGLASSCKSKDVPKEDPQKKIDKAYEDHMNRNEKEYEKDPD